MITTGLSSTTVLAGSVILFGLFLGLCQGVIHRWRTEGSRGPYRTARLEGTTLVLPGRRVPHVAGAALVILVGLGILWLGWSSRHEGRISAFVTQVCGLAFVLGSAGILRWAVHPGEVRMDPHHVTVDGRFYRATLRWEQVTFAHSDYFHPRINIRFTPPAVALETRQRWGQLLNRTLVIPHLGLYRARLVARLIGDLADLDVQGRHEVLTQSAIPMLTIPARTRSRLDLVYEDQIRPEERRRETIRRQIQESPGQPW